MELNDQLHIMIEKSAESYAQGWATDAANMNEIAAYGHAADMITIRDEDIYCDIGCGFGHMTQAMQTRATVENVRMCIGGIDNSATMLTTASAFAHGNGMNYAIYAYETREQETQDGNTFAHRKFVYDKSKADELNLLAVQGRIDFIQDDIRQADVLRKVLGNRKLSSASLMFPGVDPSTPYVYPNPLSSYEETAHKNLMLKESAAVRKAASNLLSDRVKFGGELVLAERYIRTDPNGSTDALIHRIVTSKMPDILEYWDIHEYRNLVRNIDMSTEEDLGTQNESGEVVIRNEIQGLETQLNVALIKLIRKRKTYKPTT